MGVVVFPYDNFHILLYKIYLSLEFSSFLSNYAKYLILENSCLAMKHDNSSLLPFPIFSRTFSSIHCYFQHACRSYITPGGISMIQQEVHDGEAEKRNKLVKAKWVVRQWSIVVNTLEMSHRASFRA